ATMTAPARRYTGVPGFDVGTDEPAPPSIPKPDGKTIILRGVQVPLTSDVGGAFVTDLSRNKERLFSDQQVCEKYDITSDAWTEITQSKAVRLAVNAEHERRMLNGDAAREAAAKQFTKAPEVLGKILENERNSPKHRIDAARELRATASPGADRPGDTADRVIISINLGADEKLVFDSGPLPPKKAKENFDAETEQ